MKNFKTTLNIIFFWLAVSMLAYGFAKFTRAAIINSTVDSTTIGATTPSSVVATQLGVNTGVTNSGGGFKHTRVASCTTAATTNATCTTTVTWPGGAFADTSYTFGCISDGNGAANFQGSDVANKTAASIHAIVQNTPGNSAATSVTLNCWGMHD